MLIRWSCFDAEIKILFFQGSWYENKIVFRVNPKSTLLTNRRWINVDITLTDVATLFQHISTLNQRWVFAGQLFYFDCFNILTRWHLNFRTAVAQGYHLFRIFANFYRSVWTQTFLKHHMYFFMVICQVKPINAINLETTLLQLKNPTVPTTSDIISLTVCSSSMLMSRTRFKVNPHSIVAWISRNSLLEAGAKSEV